MKKLRLMAMAMVLALVFILAGYNSNKTWNNTGEMPETRVEETSDGTEITGKGERTVTMATLPKELAHIPEDYFEESEYPGTLVELEYDTYESMAYEEQGQVLHKRAIVYLSYGYSEEEKYGGLYLNYMAKNAEQDV